MRALFKYSPLLVVLATASSSGFAQTEFKPSFGLNDPAPSGNSKAKEDLHRMENWDGTEKSVVKVEQQSSGPRFKTSIFTKHRSKFQAVCRAMRQDGRSDAFNGMMEANAYKDDTCPACKPLLSALASACRPEKPRLTKEQKEQGILPTPFPKQREPNAAVVDALALLFSAILEENREAPEMPEVMKAIERMQVVLKAKEGRSAGEQEYFERIAFHSFHPFESYLAEQARIKAKGPSISGAKDSGAKLDELFNF